MTDLADRLADLTLALVAIPSVTGDEAAIAERVGELARSGGATVSRHGNAVVAISSGEGPGIGLFGHLDTVKPHEDQATERRGTSVHGCGASDMKGALAVMLALLEAKPRRRTIFVFYDQEEGPYATNGLRSLLDAENLPEMALGLALEPTSNAIQAGCLGGLHARVTFEGRRAHSARPWQGENALYKATRYLDRLAARDRTPVSVGGLVFYEVMTATMAQTFNSRNVVPDRFALNVNYRFAPGKALAAARAELEEMVRGEAAIDVIDEAPSGAVSIDQPLLAEWMRKHVLLVEPKQAWTDVAQLTAHGIPAVNFGPGDPAQAHQAGEFVEVDDLVKGYLLLADLVGVEGARGPGPGQERAPEKQ